MVVVLITALICFLLFLAAQQIYSVGKRKGIAQSENSLGLAKIVNEDLVKELEDKKQEYAKLLNQKKSSEVRTGKIAEQLAPFLEGFPVSTRGLKFLGDPIDYIHFDLDNSKNPKITFIEIKSGKARKTKSQNLIKAIIDSNNIKFMLIRIAEDGMIIDEDY